MNGGLDKVSYIIKRQGFGLVLIIVHVKSAGIEKFVVNQHKYINYRSKGEGLTVCDTTYACNHVHFCVGNPVM